MFVFPGVITLLLEITRIKQSKLAVFISLLVGLVVVIIIWTFTAYKLYGEVTISTTA